MKRKLAVLLAAVMLFCFTACGRAEKSAAPAAITFTDDVGTVITLESSERVAVLFSSFAEIWQLAGGETTITVGESVERGFADSDVLLVDSGAGKAINTELLVSYEPDFVICSADIAAQAQAAEQLNALGIPAAQLRVESFEDYLRVLGIFTDITDNKQSYRENGLTVKQQIDEIISGCEKGEKNILFIRAGSSAKSTKAKTAGEHFAAEMLRQLGAHNIAEDAPVLLDGLSIEEILIRNPEFIFITTMGDTQAATENMKKILITPEWQSLDAVKNSRVYFLPKDLFQFKPNARWALAYSYLAEILNGN